MSKHVQISWKENLDSKKIVHSDRKIVFKKHITVTKKKKGKKKEIIIVIDGMTKLCLKKQLQSSSIDTVKIF